MPGAQERVLRQRIASTQNTKKITRAMELIAATRVVKAQMAANEARPYSEQITSVIANLAQGGVEVAHPLLRQSTDVRKVGVLVLSADRGLAGAYNSTVIRAAERVIQKAKDSGQSYSLVTVGRKAQAYFEFRNYRIEAAFEGMSDRPNYEVAREIAGKVTGLFNDDVDVIELVYTRFISMGTQEAVVRRFLPLETSAADDAAGSGADDAGPSAQVEFEPSPAEVLESLLPRYVESRIFAALLDSAASELASRQRAMKSATDNAQELIIKLQRKMNQARQDAITTEISEIVGGANALNDDADDPEDLLLDHISSDPFPALTAKKHTNI
ncbi:MAG: F0F1 ATP synthase subunit gamma [Microthrixaceae bacterium]|nr:F0F1 ATP synthase subunit gamma [Microthrixaceae bacterium]